jgi:hydrogenase maturation protease
VFPDVVDIVEGGEDGMSLLPAIRSAEEVVIIDAVSALAKAGSIFMFNSEEMVMEGSSKLSLHDAGILEAIKAAALMGDDLDATIIGIQPKKVEEFGSELSKPVARNMSRVVEIILDLMASRDLNPEPRDSRSMVNPSEWNNSA